MRIFSLVLALAALTVFATTTPAQNKLVTSSTSPAPLVSPVAAPANVAVIDTSAFSDDKTGITRVINALKGVDTKYAAIRTEIQGLQQRLDTLKQNLEKNQATQAANVTQQQVEEGQRLEVQIKRKAEDAQAGYQRDQSAALEPLQTDIYNSLNAYAKTKGFNLVIDASRVPVLFVDPTLDVTKDFIAEYNKTHP
jgi:Skp family chaperone for outer membrane proteins